ncbi:MAG: SHOCT domain-containing protein [Phycisphaerales bacterium]|nr:SHOCT domain-containing protein [Phycisphaerales bacterium]
MVTTLATISTLAETSPREILYLTGILVGVIVAMSTFLLFLRCKTKSMGGEVVQSSSIMDSLRRMHAEGKLSDEEFQAARAKLVSKIRTGIEKPSGAGTSGGSTTPAQGVDGRLARVAKARPVPGQPKPTSAPPGQTDNGPPTGGKPE